MSLARTLEAELIGLRGPDLNSGDRIRVDLIIDVPIFVDPNSVARILVRRDAQNGAARRRSANCFTKVRRSWYKLPRNR